MPVSNPQQRRVGWLSVTVLGVLAAGAIAWASPLSGLFDSGDSGPEPLPIAPSVSLATLSAAAPDFAAMPARATDADAAEALVLEGEFDDAASGYWHLASATGGEERAELLLAASLTLIDGGEDDAANAVLVEAAAAAPPGSPSATRIAYLLGRRLNALGDYAEAATVLTPVLYNRDLFGPYAQFEMGRTWLGLDEEDAAIATWELIDPGTVDPMLAGSIARQRATLAGEDGDKGDYAEWMQRYVALAPTDAGRFEYALAARGDGDRDVWEEQLRLVIAANPGSMESLNALEHLLAEDVPVDAGLAGQVFYRTGNHEAALGVLLPSVEDEDDGDDGEQAAPELMARRFFYVAAVYEERGDLERAIDYYDRAAATKAPTVFTHDAGWWAATLTEQQGDVNDASKRYRELALGPRGGFTEEAAFRAGAVLLEDDEEAYDEALAAWKGLEEAGGPRVQLWQAETLVNAGRRDEAEAIYTALAGTDGHDFYSNEARHWLGMPVADAGTYVPLPEDVAPDWDELDQWLNEITEKSDTSSAQRSADAARGLASLGLDADAAAILRNGAVSADPRALAVLARGAYEAGLPAETVVFGKRLGAIADAHRSEIAPPVAITRLQYPVFYDDSLGEVAVEYDIDPRWLAALILTESAWNPAAGSHAGALGLTQVVPDTGAAIANVLDVPGFTEEDLYSPAISLRFGAYYIAEQLDVFPSAAVALAAYNAGPGNADRWLEEADGDSGARFAETVDFEETYDYVRLVLDAYGEYVAAYAVADGS